MLNILYWSALTLITILLAWASAFSVIPLVFLGGGAVIGVTYLSFLYYRRRRSGQWEHSTHQFRFAGTVFIYIAIYWTTVGLFSNVKESRDFLARYEPYIADGAQHGYTFHYVDHADCYERIDSPELNRLLEERKPDRVRLRLQTVKDFGRLRAYSVLSVEAIPVYESWIGGTPPWEVLRQPAPPVAAP